MWFINMYRAPEATHTHGINGYCFAAAVFYLGDIKKYQETVYIAMTGMKDPTRLIVIIIVAEPTFLKAFF